MFFSLAVANHDDALFADAARLDVARSNAHTPISFDLGAHFCIGNRLTLLEAEIAFEEGEVPIGAVLVRDGAILAASHNRVEALRDASAHAEMLCARAAATAEGTWRLSETTLYCTVEPCPMCLAALHAFRIERLVYGTTNPRLGAVESALGARLPLAVAR